MDDDTTQTRPQICYNNLFAREEFFFVSSEATRGNNRVFFCFDQGDFLGGWSEMMRGHFLIFFKQQIFLLLFFKEQAGSSSSSRLCFLKVCLFLIISYQSIIKVKLLNNIRKGKKCFFKSQYVVVEIFFSFNSVLGNIFFFFKTGSWGNNL